MAISGADGRFQFAFADPGFETLQVQATWAHPTVAALAPGFGPAWASFTSADEARDVTLKLVRDDVPIVGRVVDLEGRPVPGVTIRPVGLCASPRRRPHRVGGGDRRGEGSLRRGDGQAAPDARTCSAGARTWPSRPMPRAGSA